jgi:hypothetical protein
MRQPFLIAVLLLTAGTAQAQQLADSGSFFVTLGRDTVAVERYTRTKNQLIGEALMRTPVTRHLKLTVTFKDDGTLSWWEVINSPVPGVPNSPGVSKSVVTLLGDSAQVEVWAGATPLAPRRIAAHPQMMPLQIPFYSTYETALQRARAHPADTVLSMLSGNAPLDYTIKFPEPDSVTLFNPQVGTSVARLDGAGRLLSFNAEGTTFKVHVIRAQPVDLQPYAVRYAKADAQGKSVGFLSPRDTVDVTVNDAAITIDYARPFKRGRVIFGGIVPWNEVWRTGANAATNMLLENMTMVIGDTKIPPGKYTLWTLPSKTGWKLIVNKQTGQWGTIYDPKQDLARIDVKTESVAVPVEQFTIAVRPLKPHGKDGLMTLTWDRTRVVVPFKVE